MKINQIFVDTKIREDVSLGCVIWNDKPIP